MPPRAVHRCFFKNSDLTENLNMNRATSQPAPIRLERELLKAMSQTAPARLLAQVALEWVCIVATICAAVHFSSIPAGIVCMLAIGTRQHALLVLMHEFSHCQFSRKRKWLNDMIGDIFTAFPFFITVHGFRRDHMPHHRYVSTAQDPNWRSSMKKQRFQFPMKKRQFFLEVLKHAGGIYTWSELKGYTVDAGMSLDLPLATRLCRIVFVIVLVGAASYFHLWQIVLLYWLFPLFTVLMGILYIRDVAEHFGMPKPGMYSSRTVRARWLERLMLCQNGVNFHAEHHLFPSIPFFRLKQLHHHLMKDDTYRNQALVTEGYLSGLVYEITRTPH
ncbi:MAG: fatty acid desaturase family protein [Collimonas sp.]|uniref:fatty acid desaturase family protein n=1 Tax=Collimonas sp. TaxID=1963772 RepID=UPI003266EF79